MAEFRTVHTRIWEDEWFCGLSSNGKTLFFYFFTNHRASVAGIYHLPFRCIPFETGLSTPAVQKLLSDFEAAGKVFYDHERGIVWVKNMRRYQDTGSSRLAPRIDKDIALIPDCKLKQTYLDAYGIDTVSTGENTPSADEKYGSHTDPYDTVTDTVTDTGTVTDTVTEPRVAAKPQNLLMGFDAFWQAYPRKVNKRQAEKCWIARRKAGIEADLMATCAKHYRKHCEDRQTETDYIMYPSTFIGTHLRYEEYQQPSPKPAPKASDGPPAIVPRESRTWRPDADIVEGMKQRDREKVEEARRRSQLT